MWRKHSGSAGLQEWKTLDKSIMGTTFLAKALHRQLFAAHDLSLPHSESSPAISEPQWPARFQELELEPPQRSP